VTAKAILVSPRMIGGIQSCNWAWVPNSTMARGPKTFMWMAEAAAMAPAEQAIRRITTAHSRTPRPEPPSSSGKPMPSQPPSAMAR
jgi:hypothetical protein